MVAQIAIGLAEVEWNSIEIAAPALEERRRGLVTALLESNYCTRFPASLDASFAKTRRYAEPPSAARVAVTRLVERFLSPARLHDVWDRAWPHDDC